MFQGEVLHKHPVIKHTNFGSILKFEWIVNNIIIYSLMEIKKEDVTKLILQYLRENGYNKSFMTLSEESNVTLNIMDQQEDFKNDIETGIDC